MMFTMGGKKKTVKGQGTNRNTSLVTILDGSMNQRQGSDSIYIFGGWGK